MEGFEVSSSSSSTSDDVPSDIIFEIITRISFETLRRSRLVCKEWQRFTHESYFTRLHCERTSTVSGYFIQSEQKCVHYSTFMSIPHSPSTTTTLHLSLDFLPRDVKIVASSGQGLLVCVSQGTRIPRYFVCKPTTGEWKHLPNPKTRYFTIGTAMVVQSDLLRFKIVRFSEPSFGGNNLRCEIFDSKGWAWRRSSNVKLPDTVFLKRGPSIFASGAFHWLTNNDSIFVFDIGQESWRLMSLPKEEEEDEDEDDDDAGTKVLVQCEGKLALFCVSGNFANLWVMMDYTREVWIKKQQLNLEKINKEEPHNKLIALHNTDMAVIEGFNKFMWYKFQNNNSLDVKIDKCSTIEEVFMFQSDFESCSLLF